MQGDLSIKQRDRLGGRQPEPRENLFGLALQLRFNTARIMSVLAIGDLPVLFAKNVPQTGNASSLPTYKDLWGLTVALAGTGPAPRTPRPDQQSPDASTRSPDSDEPGASRRSPAASGRPVAPPAQSSPSTPLKPCVACSSRIPPSARGIHRNDLSDFPGPPQPAWHYLFLREACHATHHATNPPKNHERPPLNLRFMAPAWGPESQLRPPSGGVAHGECVPPGSGGWHGRAGGDPATGR